MSKGKTISAYTKVPEYFFTHILPEKEYGVIKVFGIVVRRTEGWEDLSTVSGRKESDAIARSQFMLYGNMSDATAKRALKQAVITSENPDGCILRIKDARYRSKQAARYALPAVVDSDADTSSPFEGTAEPEFVITPNWYFDKLFREDDLCVAKVVGALIYRRFARKAFPAKDGSKLPMSVDDLVKMMHMGKPQVVKALQIACEKQYIKCLSSSKSRADKSLYVLRMKPFTPATGTEMTPVQNETGSVLTPVTGPQTGFVLTPTKYTVGSNLELVSPNGTSSTCELVPGEKKNSKSSGEKSPAEKEANSRVGQNKKGSTSRRGSGTKEPSPYAEELKALRQYLYNESQGYCYLQQGTWAIWTRHFKTLLATYSVEELQSAISSYRVAGYPLDKPNVFMAVVNDAVRHELRPYDKAKHLQKYSGAPTTTVVEQVVEAGGRLRVSDKTALELTTIPNPLEELFGGDLLDAEREWRKANGIGAPVFGA